MRGMRAIPAVRLLRYQARNTSFWRMVILQAGYKLLGSPEHIDLAIDPIRNRIRITQGPSYKVHSVQGSSGGVSHYISAVELKPMPTGLYIYTGENIFTLKAEPIDGNSE